MNTQAKEQIKSDLSNYVSRQGSMNAASKALQSVSIGTVSNILAGKWDNISAAMWTSIQKQVTPSAGWVIVPHTTRFEEINRFYRDAQRYSEVFCLTAPEGTGKSVPGEYFAENQNVFLVECAQHLNRHTFLRELLKSMGKDYTGLSVYEMLNRVNETLLKLENPLFIWDEADKLTDAVLLFFISIFNKTEDKCGIVLQATSNLEKRIKDGFEKGKPGFKEVYSRIGRNFIGLDPNSREDLAAIVRANGIADPLEVTRIINESEGDIRRIKRLVKGAIRRERSVA